VPVSVAPLDSDRDARTGHVLGVPATRNSGFESDYQCTAVPVTDSAPEFPALTLARGCQWLSNFIVQQKKKLKKIDNLNFQVNIPSRMPVGSQASAPTLKKKDIQLQVELEVDSDSRADTESEFVTPGPSHGAESRPGADSCWRSKASPLTAPELQ
jgi:hypothetical protein